MSNPFDKFDSVGAGASSNPFDQFDSGTPAKNKNKGIVSDLVTDLKRGIQQLPGIATGLLDIPIGGATGEAYAGKAADALGDITGFKPSQWAKDAQAEYSPGRQAASRNVNQAWEDNPTPFADAANGDLSGVSQIAKSYIQNPQQTLGSIVESLPSMAAGGIAGRAAMGIGARGVSAAAGGIGAELPGALTRLVGEKAAPLVAGAGGEGAVMAGQQMDQLVEAGADPRIAAAASAATGIAGGAIGAMGGKLAQKMGVIDPETAMAGGALRGVTDEAKDQTVKSAIKDGAKRMAGGAVSEGVFEELPQSVLEQALSNLAQGKPWDEGVARAAVEGTLAGAAMGGAFNVLPGKHAEPTSKPPVAGQGEEQKPTLALPAPTYTGTPGDQIVANDVERQAAIDKAQADSDAIWAARDEYERQQAEYRKQPIPTIINDPEPIQQRIDALMGINESRLQGFARTNYEKALENAFNEQIGVVSGKDGKEVPFTMGDYLKSKLAVADMERKQQATQPASAAAAPKPEIPVVGPLSAAANVAVQSGAHANTVMQQAAAMAQQAGIPNGDGITAEPPAPNIVQQAPNTQPQGEGGMPVTAQQAGSAAASQAGGEFDVSSRTEPQLTYLALNGQPGWKEAAVAELQRRGKPAGSESTVALKDSNSANGQQAAAGIPAATAGGSRPAPADSSPVAVNADEDQNAPTYGGKFDDVFKGKVPKGFGLVGQNTDGKNVYDAGGIRLVEDGDYFVRERTHKPKSARYAEFKTKEEIANETGGNVTETNIGNTAAAPEPKAEKPLKSPTEGGPADSIGWTSMTTVQREGLLHRAGYSTKDMKLNIGGKGLLNRAWDSMGKGAREKLIAAHESQFKPADQNTIKNEAPANTGDAAQTTEQNQNSVKKIPHAEFTRRGDFWYHSSDRAKEIAKAAGLTATVRNEAPEVAIAEHQREQIAGELRAAGIDARFAAVDGQSQPKTEPAPEAAPAKAEETTQQSDQFADNKIFTADKVAAARARMKAKLGTMNSGIDPELLIDGMTIAGAYIESGVRKFGDYAKVMIADLGDGVKPYLLSFYEAARAYPGLNKLGMDTQEAAAAQHQALLTPEVKAAAKEVIGESPNVEKKRPANLGEALRLKADWGVPNIDGYTQSPTGKNQETDFGLKGGIKDEFLADASRYLKAVAKLLEAQGFTAHLDSKGKPMKLVSANEAGPAVSGEVSLIMRKGDFGIYAQVGTSAVRGIGPNHPQGVSLIARTTTDATKHRYGEMNNWLPLDLSSGNLAGWFDSRFKAYQQRQSRVDIPAASATLEAKENTNENSASEPVGNNGQTVSGDGATGNVSAPARESGTGRGGITAGRGSRADVRGNDGSVDGRREGNESGRSEDAGDRSGTVSDDAGKPDRRGGDSADARIPERNGSRHNYVAPVGALKRTGSWLDTAKRNVEIIKLVKRLDGEGRTATPEEQALIAQYVGFGASELANGLFPPEYEYVRTGGRGYQTKKVATGRVDENALKPGWKEVYFDLKNSVSAEDMKQIMSSTQFAHFTSESVIRSIWKAVSKFGFSGGKIVDPGMGTGLFMVAAPEQVANTSRYVGIERDSVTAAIAKQLLQGQNVIRNSYIDQNLPDNNFDMAIGNPPFAGWKVMADPRYKKFGFLLHDYFFAKTIDKVRPGGILVFVTSKGTMDKQDDKARAYLAERADLLGAIRLPQTAFKGNAGTEVVTDVLFLKKREDGAEPSVTGWTGLKEVQTPQGPTLVNEYFADHPDMVLGRHELAGSMYRANEYTVTPLEGDIEEHFAKAVERLPANVYTKTERIKRDNPQGVQKKSDRQEFNVANKKEGGLYIADDGEMMQVVNGVGVPLSNLMKLSDKERAWLADYVPLRDKLKQAMSDQLADGDWESSLADLKKAYAAFKKRHGRILDHTTYEREFENDAGDIETRVYKRFKWNRLLKSAVDVEVSLVQALEAINENNSDVTDGGILVNGRVLSKRADPEIKTVNDAFAVTLNTLGRLDVPHIADLMNLSEDEAIKQLGDLIYEHPVDGWQTADEYLSGNVLKKLEEAEVAASTDPRYQRNVQALIAVQPAPLGPDRIVVRLGANWIPANAVRRFTAEALGDGVAVSYEPRTNRWTVEGENLRSNRAAGAEWGTADRSMPEILSSVLNNESITIRRTTEDKKTYVDKDATAKANDVAEKMRQRFANWVWTDAERTEDLLSIYNRKFNNLAPRTFDGKHLTLPGLSLRYKLYDHQLRAIWRVVQTGNTYLDHAVGAGKTLEMIVSAMEQKRLGLISKPMFVVPNHMLEQFANEFQEAYPAARILVADKENFVGDERRRFVAKAALNDWDAIVIKQSSFGLIGIKQETAESVADDMLDELQSALDETDKGDRTTRKKLEAQIDGLKQRVSSMVGKGDGNVTFEELGVDFLYVDEAHTYRKLDYATNRQIKGIDPNGSKGAFGMFAKMRYLDMQHPGRSAVMASGTPVTNTIAELYTVQRFMDYQGLREDGLHAFDAWANNFGAVGQEWERNAAGEYEKVERFSKFVNVPELMQRVRKFMDVLTMEQLGQYVVRPELKGGQPEMITAEKSDALDRYMREVLLPRLEESKKWKPTKDQPYNPDPVIAIGTDGRLAAIDARFAYPSMKDDPGSKLNKMIDAIIDEHKATAKKVYTTGGKTDAIKGGTQIVFSSVGFGDNVEQNRGFSPRKWMMERLKKAGIQTSEVAFMSDYKTDKQKETMFKEMREGKKRILVGSPANMGTGVNVQKRLTTLHFMAPPWFPSDVEQPHGRILRQGNQNKEVGIKWYVTAGTYDSTMWGMVRRKGTAIEQAFRGDGARTVEDISEVSSYAMAEAVAAGDDRVIKLAEAQANVEKYTRLKNAHFNEQRKLRGDIASLDSDVRSSRSDILRFEKAIAEQKEAGFSPWGEFPVTVGGQTLTKAGELGERLGEKVAKVFSAQAETNIGKVLDKFDLVGTYSPMSRNYSNKEEVGIELRIGDVAIRVTDGTMTRGEWAQQDAVGLGQRVKNAMRKVEERLNETRRRLKDSEAQLAKKRPLLGAPFADESLLAQSIADAAQIQSELVGESIKKQQAAAEKNGEKPTEQDGAGNIANKADQLSAADKAVYGMVAEGKSAADILKFIASASRNPFNRQLAKLLLKTGILPKVMAGTAQGWKFNAGNDKKYAAAYNQATDTIALFRPAAAERNFLHEAIHAATIRALGKKGLAAGQMRALFNHVKKSGMLKGMYGMSDVDEFVAEAFTNPKFQAALKKVGAPKTSGNTLSSAWHWFVRIVKGILGLPANQESALSQALEIGLGVMREDMKLRNGGVVTEGNASTHYADGGKREISRFSPTGHAQYISELKNVLMKLTSSDKATRDKAGATYFKVMNVPPVIRNILAKDGSKPFKRLEQGIWGSGSSIASKATDTHAVSRHDGAVDANVVLKLPQLIADPIAVFSSEGGMNANSYRVVVPGAVVAIEPKGLRGFVMTVHPLDGKSLQRWADAGLLHYVNEKAAITAAESGVLSMGQFQQFTSSETGSQTVVPKQSQDLAVEWSMAQENAVRNGRTVMTKADIEALPDAAVSPSGGVRYNVADEGWSVSEPSKMDDVIYALQDKQIDLKRVMQSIMATGKKIKDNFNAYLQEELFHGRAAKGVKDFLDFELRPLLSEMNKAGIDAGDFEEYLWNRHAEERNKQIAKINPDMPDGGSGIDTADARAYLAGLSKDQRAKYEALSKRIDAINRNSQGILVSSGLETQSTIDAWNGAYQHYVPLQREDVDSGHIGTGKGFSVRGSASKRAMGSGKKVVDIIANIAMQRERNIVRAEKNRVSNAVYGLAAENPNPDFWKVDQAPKERVVNKVFVYTVRDVQGNIIGETTKSDEAERVAIASGGRIEQDWKDRVEERVIPGFTSRDNVLHTRINGKDHYIIFNERDDRALRMAMAMKNLDVDNMGRVLSIVSKGTRYLASVNTQFNPVFGVINLIRDVQGALINLSSTPLAGEQRRVLGYTKDALVGIYKDIRAHRAGKKPSSNWAELFEEFQKEGGQTGYRDQYDNAESRAEAIKSELEQFKEGKAKQLARGLFGWLSDYNETMENAVRLAAYKAAKEKGMSKAQAASLAKNLTVNFNRKGQMATQVGALYAFFNASVQGSARIAETLFEQHGGDMKNVRLSKTGKKILVGGIMLGSMQALLLAAAGYDDDEPPEFVRERNLILPIGDGKYLTLAMPLGFHVLPGIGRIATEFVMSGGKEPIKKLASFGSMFAEAFNPIGNSGFSLQTITPSLVDPFAALAENKDFTGKEIYREDFNKLKPTPGHARAKDVATVWSRYISEAINFITGGTEFKPGLFSPSPDSIDYLIAQLTGGVGREANKVAQTIGATSSGEDLPLYKVPLVGRFVGDTEGQSGQSAKFYDAIKQINMHEAEYKGLLKDGRRQEAMEYMAENPVVKLIMAGNHAETMVRKLRNMKRDLVESDAESDKIHAIDERITATMRAFNERARAVI